MTSRARDKAGKTADRSFPDDNSGVIMASTGARGSTLKYRSNDCRIWANNLLGAKG